MHKTQNHSDSAYLHKGTQWCHLVNVNKCTGTYVTNKMLLDIDVD